MGSSVASRRTFAAAKFTPKGSKMAQRRWCPSPAPFCPRGRVLAGAPLWGAFSLSASFGPMLRVRARFVSSKQPLSRVGNKQVPVGVHFPLNGCPALLLAPSDPKPGGASIRSRNGARAVNSMRLSPAAVIGFPPESAMRSTGNPASLEQVSFPVEESARTSQSRRGRAEEAGTTDG
jgi:hypothetical protein